MAVFLIAAAVSIAASAAAAAISSALTPEQVNTERLSKGKQDNFNSPRSSYGDTISRVWGIGRVGGILAQATIPPIERVTEKITRKHQGGKGLGGGQTQITEEKTYTYHGNCVFIFCTEVTEIIELRLNSKLIWKEGTFRGILDGQGCFIRIYTGSGTQEIDPLLQSLIGDDAIPYRHRTYVVIENLPLIEFGDSYPQCSAVLRNGHPKLSEIITDLCLESPHVTVDDLDVSEVSDIDVSGFQLNSETTPAEALAQLQKAYFFDLIDHGDKLKFQPQFRSSSVAYIPPSQLASYEDGQERPSRYRESRTDPAELPTQCEITYLDINNNLLAGVARSHQFPFPGNHNLITFNYAGALSSAEAKTIANRLLWLDHTRATNQEISLPPKYLNLEPGDVIEIDIGQIRQKVQIRSLEIGANYQVLARTVKYNGFIYGWTETADATYTAGATANQGSAIDVGRPITGTIVVTSGSTVYTEGIDYAVNGAIVTPLVSGAIANGTPLVIRYEAPQEPRNTPLPPISNTTLRVLDLPLVYDGDKLGVYVFGDGDTNWRNAFLYLSRDSGVAYYPADLIATRSIFGTCDTTLPYGTLTGIDTTGALDITVPGHAELESISTDQFDLGENRALVGDEILDFQTATLLGLDGSGNRQYRLSNFKRGLRGTYDSVAGHQANENFYLLSEYNLQLEGRADDIGKTLYFKAVTIGQTLDDANPVTLLIEGNALKALTVKITDFAPRQGTSGDTITITGQGFTGTTAIAINSVNVSSFVIESDTAITAVIADNTSTGKITVTTPLGVAESTIDFQIADFLTLDDIEKIRFFL